MAARHQYYPFNLPVYPPANDIEEMDDEENEADDGEEQEEEDDVDDGEEQEEENETDEEEEEQILSELNESEAGSRQSTPATTASSNTLATTTSTTSDHDDVDWIRNPALKIETLEELRGSFRSELEEPSAWVLQRVATLTNAGSEFGPRLFVRTWYHDVVRLTGTPAGEQLRLPLVTRPENTPFHRAIAWEEANQLVGEAREWSFGRNVGEEYKQIARLSINFLIPEARTEGLSAGDKRRIFTVASSVWAHDRHRAEGLLWVLEKEYPYTRQGAGREWANSCSEEFMVYTILYPPPIVIA